MHSVSFGFPILFYLFSGKLSSYFFQKTGISHDPVFKPFLTEPSGVCKENRQIRLANSLSDV
jgi:hypothetical protein